MQKRDGGVELEREGLFEQRVTGRRGEWKGIHISSASLSANFTLGSAKRAVGGEILGTLQDESPVEWNLKFGSTIPFPSPSPPERRILSSILQY